MTYHHRWDCPEDEKLSWKQWNPGLDNGHLILGEVMSTMPANTAEDIHWIVKLFENPEPPFRFPGLFPLPGAITLERHDCIHALLGRGMLPQDEAFVIGFTMGATKACGRLQYEIFRFVSKHLYPGYYKFNDEHLLAFEIGFMKGLESISTDLGNFPFERFLDLTLDDLRSRLGINRQKLYAVYRYEKTMLPHTVESKRLDTDWMGVDPSSIRKG